MSKFEERSGYNGSLKITEDSNGVAIDVVEDGNKNNFLVRQFDQPIVALEVLGLGDADSLPIPPADADDDTLINIARGALKALKGHRAEAARQEESRKVEIEEINKRLEGQNLSLVQPLGPQLHAFGFRLAGGAA